MLAISRRLSIYTLRTRGPQFRFRWGHEGCSAVQCGAHGFKAKLFCVSERLHDLLHRAEVLGDGESGRGPLPDLFDADASGRLGEGQAPTAFPVDLEDPQFGDDGGHDVLAGERQVAAVHDLAPAVLVGVVGADDDLGAVRVAHEVHGAAHAVEGLPGDDVVGQVAAGADLEGPQQGDVDVAAADHAEALGAVKGARPGDEGDGLLAGVDRVGVGLAPGARVGAHPDHAVLRLQPDLRGGRQETGGERGDPDPQVDVHAVLELEGGSAGDAVTRGGLAAVGLIDPGRV